MTSQTHEPAAESAAVAGHAGGEHVVVDHSHHLHVCTPRIFLGIYMALLFFTILTVAVSRIDFGGFNLVIAMAVAAVKASLVMSVFMHLRWDTAINNIAFLSSILFLALLFLFTLADIATRGDVDPLSLRSSPLPVRAADPADIWYFHSEGDH